MVRISRKFRDISFSFARNPVNDDILSINDADAIKRAVINLVRTKSGERFYDSLVGTEVEASLFEVQSPEVANNLKIDIENVLKNYEPRVADVEVEVNYPLDSNEIYIQIAYTIVGLPLPTQNIEFVLQSTRV
jgi:phage baseplate assembly protein W